MTTPLLSGASDSIQAAAADVAADTDIEMGLVLLSPAAAVPTDVRDRLLPHADNLNKPGSILNAFACPGLDKQIQLEGQGVRELAVRQGRYVCGVRSVC